MNEINNHEENEAAGSTPWLVGRYWSRRCGTTGHEIINGSGDVIAWSADDASAALVVAGLRMLSDDRANNY